MKSYLIGPNNKPFANVEYYELADAANHIINLYCEKDENIKKKYEEFKKDYTYFNPDIDFLLCHLGYKLNYPFITDDGILCGNEDGLKYIMHPDTQDEKTYNYPTASDKDLGIKRLKVENLKSSVIDPNGIYYEVDRDKNYIHQYIFEIILLQKASKNKKLYEDYLDHYDINDELFYIVNAYFKNRLGYAYVQQYENKAGYIFYNKDIINNRVYEIIKSIKNVYSTMELTPSSLPYDMISSTRNIMNEMSDTHESRRL